MRRVASGVLIGRGRELRELETASIRALGGSGGRFLIVAGEAGIGKSRLVAAATSVTRTPRVVAVVGHSLDLAPGTLPYGPFVEALRMLLASLDPSEKIRVLGPDTGTLALILPELGEFSTHGDDGPRSARLLAAIAGTFARAAEAHGLILTLEDIHWLDPASRDMLRYLVNAIRPLSILVIATLRSDEVMIDGEILRLLADVQRAAHVDRIDVGPFTPRETAQLLGELFDEPPDGELAARIHDRSDGSPYFIEEIVALGAEAIGGISPSVRDILLSRLGSVDEATRSLVSAASVAGRQVSARLLASVMRSSPAQLMAALHQAVDEHLLVADDPGGGEPGFIFRHALMHEAVYADLLPGERRHWHARWAEIMEGDGGSAGPHAPQIAEHWERAGQPERGLRALSAAAAHAADVYAFADADELYGRALELAASQPGVDTEAQLDTLNKAAEAAQFAGRPETAVRRIQAAVDLVDDERDRLRSLDLRERLGRLTGETRRAASSLAILDAAVAALRPDDPPCLRARLLTSFVTALAAGYQFERAIEVADDAVTAAQAAACPELASSLVQRGFVRHAMGQFEGALDDLRRGLRVAEDEQQLWAALLAHVNFQGPLSALGRAAALLDAGLAGVAAARSAHAESTFFGLMIINNAMYTRIILGQWDEAAVLGPPSFLGSLSPDLRVVLIDSIVELAAKRGQFDLVDRLYQGTSGHATDIDTQSRENQVLTFSESCLVRGDPGRAIEALRDADLSGVPSNVLEADFQGSVSSLAIWALADLAERLDAGRWEVAALDDLRAEADGWLTIAERALSAGPVPDRPAADTLGRVLVGRAERTRLDTPDPERWAAAANHWRALGYIYDLAYARFREGEALLSGKGGRSAASDALQEAHSIAMHLGAEPLRGWIQSLATRARIDLGTPGSRRSSRPRQRAAGRIGAGFDAHDLTKRETEVLALVARGLTNRQIAERLFISPSTAGIHVSNILGKLGASGRVEAATIALRSGIVTIPDDRTGESDRP